MMQNSDVFQPFCPLWLSRMVQHGPMWPVAQSMSVSLIDRMFGKRVADRVGWDWRDRPECHAYQGGFAPRGRVCTARENG